MKRIVAAFVRRLPPSALPGISPSRGEIRWGTLTASWNRLFPRCSPEGEEAGRRLPIFPPGGGMPGRAEGGGARHGLRLAAFVMLLLAGMLSPAFAVNPDEVLADPALEARARAISAELRCMVCQNQSIDDSNAELAKDLRLLVRERIKAGDSDREVMDYIVSRYGEFVLLKPPVGVNTILLWGMPVLLLVIGGAVLARQVARRRQVPSTAPLSAEEQKALDDILGRNGEP